MRVSIDRSGIIQTVLELFCPECGAKFRPSLGYESNNITIEEPNPDAE